MLNIKHNIILIILFPFSGNHEKRTLNVRLIILAPKIILSKDTLKMGTPLIPRNISSKLIINNSNKK